MDVSSYVGVELCTYIDLGTGTSVERRSASKTHLKNFGSTSKTHMKNLGSTPKTHLKISGLKSNKNLGSAALLGDLDFMEKHNLSN